MRQSGSKKDDAESHRIPDALLLLPVSRSTRSLVMMTGSFSPDGSTFKLMSIETHSGFSSSKVT